MEGVSSRLQRSVKEAVAWITEHKRVPVRLDQRPRGPGPSGLTPEEKKENSVARSLFTLREKRRKKELPAAADSQLEQVSVMYDGF
jgi:hypothetical protein